MEDVINMIGNQVYHIYVFIYIYICTTNQMLFYMLGLYIILPTILGISWYILLPNQPTIWIIYIYIYRSAFGLWQACRRPRVTSRVQSNIYIYILGHRIYIRIICPDIRYNIVSYIHIIYPERYISPNILVNYNDPTVLPHWNHGL